MEFSIKDLIKGAVSRAKIGKQVEAAMAVEVANQYLREALGAQAEQARAISCSKGVLRIGCKTGAASQWIAQHKLAIMEAVKRRVPSIVLENVETRVVGKFPSSEDL